MDSSQLTTYKNSHRVFDYYEFAKKQGPQPPLQIREGAPSLVLNSRLLIPSFLPDYQHILPNCNIIDSVLTAIELFFKYIIQKGYGPTVTARALYIWFMGCATALNWIQPSSSKLQGIHDEWNWSLSTNSLQSVQDEFVWFNHAIATILPIAFPGYDLSILLQQERTMFTWSEGEQSIAFLRIQSNTKWSEYVSLWTTWIQTRSTDGSQTQPQPTSAEVPNIQLSLVTNSPILPAFVDPNLWTPLKLPMKSAPQKYLTFYWDNVRSTGITSSQEINLDTLADNYYLTGAQRIAEVSDVISITGNLTDQEKVTAEYWAGGPNTVTPPGMMAWFWKEYIRTLRPNPALTIYSGLDLGIHLFEGSRITWRNKQRKVEARPIQEVRVNFTGQTFTSWDGTPISAELWTPYQESDFVTPPFADFPSGHSHFSQAFCNTMTYWFGSIIPTQSTLKEDLYLLSPCFSNTLPQTGSLATVIFPEGKSQIQNGIVPSSPVQLSWSTWQDLANSAGMSRLYGGIHCLSAHTSSQALANSLHSMIESVWNFKL